MESGNHSSLENHFLEQFLHLLPENKQRTKKIFMIFFYSLLNIFFQKTYSFKQHTAVPFLSPYL